ncbi:MAG: acetaldehyde dehydrogenase (acetylating) [Oscillospiraceae bacterium]|nr:acetaldehyde dehydrogenase (acetylating) [Oscillospiraceae bacterium]
MEFDKDLSARQEARNLCRQAQAAAAKLRCMTQAQLDAITVAIADAFSQAAKELAEAAVRETGFGNAADKTIKNQFASQTVQSAIRDMQCVGVLKEDPAAKLWEIGVPVGVIAAIVPSTNPTSTVCYKAMVALKAGNAIVFSPHPKAFSCTWQAAKIVASAAEKAGAPAGAVSCLGFASMAGTQELMAAPEVKLILATGGPGMVKAAYSSGKPAIGVGAGNGPAYIHPSADMHNALDCILRSKDFDHGTVCASEQSIIIEKCCENELVATAKGKGFHFMSTEEADKLGRFLFKPNGGLSPDVVGKPAVHLAKLAGFSVPADTKILVARADQVGPKHPYSMEKLCPVLALFVEANEQAVLRKSLEILSFEGSGHTFCIHAQDNAVIRRFALEMPVSRFLVNTPAALGGIGQSTGLFPALTLGCGAVGGSSSSNNISPMDLINVRRVAWDLEKEPPKAPVDAALVELLAAKILERLR